MALSATGKSVRSQLQKKLAKADDSEDDADEIAAGLSLVPLDALAGSETILSDVASDRAGDVLAGLGISDESDFFGHANTRAAEYAKDRAASLVTDIDESTRNMLRQKIAAGLDGGLMRDDIIDSIMDSDIFGEDRATLIADHEVAMASGHGAQAGREEAVKAGVELDKGWFCDDDPCPICEDNQDAGWISNDAEFPSGDMTEVAHNRCHCHTESQVRATKNGDGDED